MEKGYAVDSLHSGVLHKRQITLLALLAASDMDKHAGSLPTIRARHFELVSIELDAESWFISKLDITIFW